MDEDFYQQLDQFYQQFQLKERKKLVRSPLETKKEVVQSIFDEKVAIQHAVQWIHKSFSANLLIKEVALKYPWSTEEDGYPPHVNDLDFPEEELQHFSLLHISDFGSLLRAGEAFLQNFSPSQQYGALEDIPIRGSHKHLLTRLWDTDEFFGWMRLGGPNPTILQKLIDPTFLIQSSKFLEIEKSLKEVADRSLLDEIRVGHIFYEDYQQRLAHLPEEKHCVIYQPCVFFWHDHINGILLPFAIYIRKQWFFPNEVIKWRFAKIATNAAYFLYHEMITHLLFTHLVEEIAIVSAYHTLPSFHPVTGLLLDHSFRTLAINHSARLTLVPNLIPAAGIPVTTSKTLLHNQWAKFHWADLNFLHQVRSCLYPETFTPLTLDQLQKDFPSYHYIHDSFTLWHLLWDYHSLILNKIYSSPDLLEGDGYLHAWIHSLHTKIPGFPKHVANVTELIEIITVFVFIATVQHSAVNYPQEAFYQNARICPSVLRKDLLEGEQFDLLLHSLPTKMQVSVTESIVTILSSSLENNNLEENFGSYVREHNEHKSFDLHIYYQTRFLLPQLRELTKKILERPPNSLGFTYRYLAPNSVATSILI